MRIAKAFIFVSRWLPALEIFCHSANFSVGGIYAMHDRESGIERLAPKAPVNRFGISNEILNSLLVILRQYTAKVGASTGKVATGAAQARKGPFAEINFKGAKSRPESEARNQKKNQPFEF